jgi:hypothetical protein
MTTSTAPEALPSATRASKAYVARQQERGFKQIKLWVPEALIQKFHNDAARARRKARLAALREATQ